MTIQDWELYLSLIYCLSSAEWRSGESIAKQLGISRAAVWKRVGKLSGLGIPVNRSRRLGYRLDRSIELLDRGQIAARVGDLIAEPPEISTVPCTLSTNIWLLDRLRLGEVAPPRVLLAEMQTGGRGRRGRNWISPFGRNIYLSYVWKCEGGVAALPGLSLAVGEMLAEALSREAGLAVKLKWPNDLLIGSRKFGGILIDIDGDLEGSVDVVIGVGINIDMDGLDAARIDQPWTDIRTHALTPVSRNELAAQIIAALNCGLAFFGQAGFPAFRDRWLARDALAGKDVQVVGSSQLITGRALSVSTTGGLLIQVGEDIVEVNSGDVSPRLL